jgi:hypothetical protein
VGGDGGAHRSRAKHRHPAYPVCHRTSTSFPQNLPTASTIASRHGRRREMLECGARGGVEKEEIRCWPTLVDLWVRIITLSMSS